MDEVTWVIKCADADDYLKLEALLQAEGIRIQRNYKVPNERRQDKRDVEFEVPALAAELIIILSDLNNVIVSLTATGAAYGIKEAIGKYRAAHPKAKVTVMKGKHRRKGKPPKSSNGK